MVDKILEIVDEKFYEYGFFGLRVDDYNYQTGDVCYNSHDLFQDPEWDINNELVYPLGEGIYSDFYDAGELDGTCAIQIGAADVYKTRVNVFEAIKEILPFEGKYIYLIAGEIGEGHGELMNEIIIKDAIVLTKFEKSKNLKILETFEKSLAAVKEDWRALQYVKEQTEEICLAAVKQDGWALQYVKEQTPELCLAAVREDGYALEFVKEQTLELCLEAVKQNPQAKKYIKTGEKKSQNNKEKKAR